MKLSLGGTKYGFIFKTMFNLTIYIPKSRLLKFHNCNHQYRICRTTHTLSTDCRKKGLSKPFGPVVREEQCATEALEASYSKTSAVGSIAFERSIYSYCLPFLELGGVHEIQLQSIPITNSEFFFVFVNQIIWFKLIETMNPKTWTNFI